MDETRNVEEQIRRRAQAALRLADKFLAEAMGLFSSLEAAEPIRYSPDEELQEAFGRGHRDGRDLLATYLSGRREGAA